MPLYEYQCDACGRRFERIQRFSDPPVEVCPACGAGPVQKLLSSPAIQFKGSGWYITDYARKSSESAAKTKEDGSASTQEASGDAKPADAAGGTSEKNAGPKPAPKTD